MMMVRTHGIKKRVDGVKESIEEFRGRLDELEAHLVTVVGEEEEA